MLTAHLEAGAPGFRKELDRRKISLFSNPLDKQSRGVWIPALVFWAGPLPMAAAYALKRAVNAPCLDPFAACARVPVPILVVYGAPNPPCRPERRRRVAADGPARLPVRDRRRLEEYSGVGPVLTTAV